MSKIILKPNRFTGFILVYFIHNCVKKNRSNQLKLIFLPYYELNKHRLKNRKANRFEYIAFIFIIFHSTFYGQILNVEKKREGLDKVGWQGNVDFTAKYTKNTTDIFQLSNRTTISYRKDLKTFLVLTDLKLIKQNTEDLINRGVIHLRYIKQLENAENLKLELFGQSQFNAVQKINLRSLLGAGYRFQVLGNDTTNLNFGTAIMYEYEESVLKTYENAIRSTNYISFNWNIKNKWKLRLISYYQPKIGKLTDYRIATETSLSYQISKQFSIVSVVTSLYDTKPIEGIPKDFFTGNLMFRYKF